MRVVRFDSSRYVLAHGASPRGRGMWGFIMGAPDYADVSEVWWAPGSPTFTEAKKLATVEARRRGVSFVGVAT